MIRRSQIPVFQREAADLISKAGIVLRPEEVDRIAVADFGLSQVRVFGTQILTWVETTRYGAKVIALFPNQILPEHWHPPVGDDPGKEETSRVAWGVLYLYVEGPDTLKEGCIPKGKEGVSTARHQIADASGRTVHLSSRRQALVPSRERRGRGIQFFFRGARRPGWVH